MSKEKQLTNVNLDLQSKMVLEEMCNKLGLSRSAIIRILVQHGYSYFQEKGMLPAVR